MLVFVRRGKLSIVLNTSESYLSSLIANGCTKSTPISLRPSVGVGGVMASSFVNEMRALDLLTYFAYLLPTRGHRTA